MNDVPTDDPTENLTDEELTAFVREHRDPILGYLSLRERWGKAEARFPNDGEALRCEQCGESASVLSDQNLCADCVHGAIEVSIGEIEIFGNAFRKPWPVNSLHRKLNIIFKHVVLFGARLEELEAMGELGKLEKLWKAETTT